MGKALYLEEFGRTKAFTELAIFLFAVIFWEFGCIFAL